MGEFEMVDLSTGIGVHTDRDGNQKIGQYDKCDWCNKLHQIDFMRKWTLDGEWGYICQGCDIRR